MVQGLLVSARKRFQRRKWPLKQAGTAEEFSEVLISLAESNSAGTICTYTKWMK